MNNFQAWLNHDKRYVEERAGQLGLKGGQLQLAVHTYRPTNISKSIELISSLLDITVRGPFYDFKT